MLAMATGVWLLSGPSRADDPELAPSEAPVEAPTDEAPIALPIEAARTPEQQLRAAIRDYQLGRRSEARDLLVDLVTDNYSEDHALRQQARVYLGEILYVGGDQEGARRFFEQVLTEDPSFEIDPYRHPPDVCGYFNYVRAYIAPTGTPDPILVARRPAPALSWIPFGAWQLKNHRPLKGVAYLLTGAASGTGSLVVWSILRSDHGWRQGDEDERKRLQRLEYLGYGLTSTFYATALISLIDSQVAWRQEAASSPSPSPLALGPQLRFSGRF